METTLGSYPADFVSAHGSAPGLRFVFLVGFMGAGKTAVGKALASHLSWEFEDLDERIVRREGRSIPQIFREFGEAEFRRTEHAALSALLAEDRSTPLVVALGGGAFVQSENARLLAEAGSPTVFLDAPVEVLFRRCQQELDVERPLRRRQEDFVKLYEVRRPLYLKAALRVETHEQSIEAVARTVARKLGLNPNDTSRGDRL
jgi:shikimate kinase